MAFVKEIMSEADEITYQTDRFLAYTVNRDWVIDRERDIFLRYIDIDNRNGMDSTMMTSWLFYYQGTYLHILTSMADYKEGIKENTRLSILRIRKISVYHDTGMPTPISLGDLPMEKSLLIELLEETVSIEESYSCLSGIAKKREYEIEAKIIFEGEAAQMRAVNLHNFGKHWLIEGKQMASNIA